jgi:glycosyltransferase involved in cell wall biosynthesis
MPKSKLIFCGELPPLSINGISISNQRILRILNSRFDILIIREKRSLKRNFFHTLVKAFKVVYEGFDLASKTVRWQPEVFYTSFPTSLIGAIKCLFFIMLFKLFSHGRVVLHVHRGDMFNFQQRFVLSSYLVKSCFDKSATILCLSKSQEVEYRKLTSTRVLTVNNSVDVRPTIWRPVNPPRLIFLSNYIEEKGLDTLLDAFKLVRKCRQIELHCYGGGSPDHYISRIENELMQDVIIHGVLSDEIKYDVLSGFSLLAFPSYNEGQPLVILEAMALGIPIVTSNVGLIPEMVGNEYPYLVPPRDVSALANAIISCLDQIEAIALSKTLQMRFNDFYSPDIQKNQILNAFCNHQM